MKVQLAPGTSFSLRSVSKTSQCDKSKLVFTLLVQIYKIVAKTVQTNAKKTTLIIHFHSLWIRWSLAFTKGFLLSFK